MRRLVGVCAPARPSSDAPPDGDCRPSGQLRGDRQGARHAYRKHRSDACTGPRALEARAPAQLPGRRPGRLTVEASAAGGVTASDVVADRTPLALWRVDDKGEGARAELRTAVVASSTTDLEPRSANRSFSFGVAPPACLPWYVTCVGPSAVIVPRTVTDPAARQSTRPDNGRWSRRRCARRHRTARAMQSWGILQPARQSFGHWCPNPTESGRIGPTPFSSPSLISRYWLCSALCPFGSRFLRLPSGGRSRRFESCRARPRKRSPSRKDVQAEREDVARDGDVGKLAALA